jgi:hypothetical protein
MRKVRSKLQYGGKENKYKTGDSGLLACYSDWQSYLFPTFRSTALPIFSMAQDTYNYTHEEHELRSFETTLDNSLVFQCKPQCCGDLKHRKTEYCSKEIYS